MKKILLMAGVFALLSSASFAQIEKGAVISVWGDKNLSDNPLDTKMYEALMKDSSFNLTKIIYEFDELLRKEILPLFPFPFMTKEEVIGSEGYNDMRKHSFFINKDDEMKYYVAPAKDYVPLAAYNSTATDKEAIAFAFEIFPKDVGAVMIAYVNFNLVDGGGVGPYSAKKVNAYCNIKIFNKEGKRIFKLKESAPSDKKISAVGGVITEPKKITPLILQASDNLFADIKKTFPKKLSKMIKKLQKEAAKK